MEREGKSTQPFRVINFLENCNPPQATISYPGPVLHVSDAGTCFPPSSTSSDMIAASSFPLHAQVSTGVGEGSSTTSFMRNPGGLSAVSNKPSLTNHMANRRLKGYSFEDSIREFTPDKLLRNKSNKRRESYVVNGVNILNREEMDSQAAISRIQKRREQHNRVERKRRDLINSAIEELSEIVPNAQEEGIKYARGNVLRLTIDYIRDLQAEVHELQVENEGLKRGYTPPRLDPARKPPMIIVNHEQPRNPPSANSAELQNDTNIKIPQGSLGFPASNVVQAHLNSQLISMASPQSTPLLSSSQGSPVSSPVSPHRLSESSLLLPSSALASMEHFRHTERRYSDGLLSPYPTTNTPSVSPLRIRDHELYNSTHDERFNRMGISQNQPAKTMGHYSVSSPPSSPHSQF